MGGEGDDVTDFSPQPCDLILSRNAGGEEANPSPGHWNHAALAISATEILEAQAHVRDGRISDDPADPGSVIVTPWEEILARYPEIVVRRMNTLLPSERENIVHEARAMVGMEYKQGASVFYRRARRRRWINCVAVCRFAYWDGTDSDFGWRLPDDIAEDERLETVWEKVPEA